LRCKHRKRKSCSRAAALLPECKGRVTQQPGIRNAKPHRARRNSMTRKVNCCQTNALIEQWPRPKFGHGASSESSSIMLPELIKCYTINNKTLTSDNRTSVTLNCRRSLEMSCPCPLEMSGSKDGLDFYERARSKADRSVEGPANARPHATPAAPTQATRAMALLP